VILRLLGPAGVAGLAIGLCLAALLFIQKGETRHWRRQSGQFEQLYHGEQAAFAGTVVNYRAAAETARAADRAAAERVLAEQRTINERSNYALETRLGDARARADRLRVQTGNASTDPGSRGTAAMPALSAPAGQPHQAAGEDGLSAADALTATEQAIQLDELIRWVNAQAKVDNNGGRGTTPDPGGR
jgi:hypothetical protein